MKILEDYQMNRQFIKLTLGCVAGTVVLLTNPKPAYAAYETSIAGYMYDKNNNNQYSTDSNITNMSLSDIPMPGFDNVGIANVNNNLNIREKPGTNEKIIAKLPKNGGCEILEIDQESGWAKIKSGKITGYVDSSYLITGTKASNLAKEVAVLVATVNNDAKVLNVRKEPTVNSEMIEQVAVGEELIVLDPLVVTYGEDYNKWVKISLDSDEEDGTVGYVSKEFVDLSYKLTSAFTLEEVQYGAGVSSKRVLLINTAKKYLGYPYRWGGNSLTKGVDCSGFTKELYSKVLGISLSRTSRQQAKGGKTISRTQLKPGDLVFYGNNTSGYINHVGIYIGDNKIIHASNKRDGIKISSMTYRQPLKYVRYIND